MTSWFRAVFLFSSFGPLYLLLCVGLVAQKSFLWPYAATLFAASLLAFLYLKNQMKRKSVFTKKISIDAPLDDSILSYLISFIPPLLVDDFSDQKKIWAILVFYMTTAALMYRSDSLYINFYFLLFGYRIFRAEIEDTGRSVVIITKRRDFIKGDVASLYEIHNGQLYYAE